VTHQDQQDQRAVVVQLGGRRQYAVPAALARTGHLEALYTDFCAGRGVGRLAPLFAAAPLLAGRIDLSRRRPPPEVLRRTRVFPSWLVEMQRGLRIRDPVERADRLRRAHDKVSASMIRAGFGGATHVLAQFNEGVGYQRAARGRGLVVATDVNIAPSTEAIVRSEQEKVSGWEAPAVYYGQAVSLGTGSQPPMDAILEVTDLFLCPSEFVRRDLLVNFGVPEAKLRFVPYPVNPKWFEVKSNPEPGRILFAGTAGLRKGIHVLAEAARILRGRRRDYRFVVAGAAPDSVRNRNETQALTFVGKLSGPEMRVQLIRADVFAFPSLAEGSAGVTYEALGCGIPVVTTFEAGSVVRDGLDGRIVPSRDPEALATAIDEIVQDRPLRDRMGRAARLHARGFDWDNFQRNLVESLFSLPADTDGGVPFTC
jgi:glycosyltransferase involved in cell wall biosynthesis